MNNNLLVVGGTGFIGSNITEEALKQGYDVTVVSKRDVPYKVLLFELIHLPLTVLLMG